MAFCNYKIAKIVVMIHSSFDVTDVRNLLEGNKVMFIRSYKMFIL